MSWHFLERWLEKANQHSTLLGKFWITLLIVCRMIVIGTLGDRVYADEQSEFRCSTSQQGCTNVCFDSFSPVSHVRFWGFQIIFVSVPSVLFILYSGHKAKTKLDMEKEKAAKDKADAKAKGQAVVNELKEKKSYLKEKIQSGNLDQLDASYIGESIGRELGRRSKKSRRHRGIWWIQVAPKFFDPKFF